MRQTWHHCEALETGYQKCQDTTPISNQIKNLCSFIPTKIRRAKHMTTTVRHPFLGTRRSAEELNVYINPSTSTREIFNSVLHGKHG
jgi:hypothetical protein